VKTSRQVLLLIATSMVACAPETRPEDGRTLTPARPTPAPPSSGETSSSVAGVESLTLTQALAHLDAYHPELEAFRQQVEAASARAEAAGALWAPVAIIRAENVPLHRGRSLDQGNYIAGLALSLPIQGRLGAARSVEEREGELVSRDLEQRRHELLRGARDAFATALAASRAAVLNDEAAQAAETTAALLERRVARGDIAPDEATWIAIEAARSRLDADRSRSQARQALARLAESLGSDRPVASVAGDLEETVGAPELAALLRRVEAAPTVRRADAAVALRVAALELARAERIPDVRLELAYRRLELTDQHAVDAGIEVPFPFLGGTSSRARAALFDLEAARARAAAARLEATREVQVAYERLVTAVRTAETLRELLPRVERALAAVSARLSRGDISALEALPARRLAVSMRLDQVAALSEALGAWAALDAALGESN
jgi:outer membrane protein, heavy metal efflux system